MRKPRKSQQAGIRGRCGARTRDGGTCELPAGWGTDHPGVGRCQSALQTRPALPLCEPEGEPVTDRDLLSAAEEVAGAMRWAERLCKEPGPKAPLMVINALRMVVDMKEKLLRMVTERLRSRDSVVDADLIRELVSLVIQAMDEAGVPDEYRRRTAKALRRIAMFGVGIVAEEAPEES